MATPAASLLVLAVPTKPAEAAFSGSSGAIAYTSDGCTPTCTSLNVWRMASDGFGATQLADDPAPDSQPAFSAEGTQIALNSARDDSDGINDWDIYRMNAAGNNETKLTTDTSTANTVNDIEPYWFPNDAKLAFRRHEINPAEANLWVLTLDENGNPTGEQRLTTNAASDIMPAVSPKGKLIAFASNGDDEVFVMNADGTKQKNLTRNTGLWDIDPVFYPDGRKMSFERPNPSGF